MSTDKTFSIVSTSLDDTLNLAEGFGQKCKGGEVFELISDLGGGKTAFVQGLARGLGVTEQVTSPTFMVERVYNGRLQLHHFDFYRLGEAGVVGEELQEVLDDPHVVTTIEWGEIVQDILPDNRISVRITKIGDNSRQIDINCADARTYILEHTT